MMEPDQPSSIDRSREDVEMKEVVFSSNTFGAVKESKKILQALLEQMPNKKLNLKARMLTGKVPSVKDAVALISGARVLHVVPVLEIAQEVVDLTVDDVGPVLRQSNRSNLFSGRPLQEDP